MDTVKVQGRSEGAAQLERIADGLRKGVVEVEGRSVEVDEHVSVVVSVSVPGSARVASLALHLDAEVVVHSHLAVESELSHPGG